VRCLLARTHHIAQVIEVVAASRKIELRQIGHVPVSSCAWAVGGSAATSNRGPDSSAGPAVGRAKVEVLAAPRADLVLGDGPVLRLGAGGDCVGALVLDVDRGTCMQARVCNEALAATL
jgi:hypothetical protein